MNICAKEAGIKDNACIVCAGIFHLGTSTQVHAHAHAHTQSEAEIVKIEFYQILPPAEEGQA